MKANKPNMMLKYDPKTPRAIGFSAMFSGFQAEVAVPEPKDRGSIGHSQRGKAREYYTCHGIMDGQN